MRKQILWFGMFAMLLLIFLTGQRVLLGAVGLRPSTAANAISTAFAYQGSLSNSLGPVTGSCDLRLTLFGQASGGGAVAGTLALDGVAVQSGLFSVQVDFGPGAFTGDSRWLETAVRCPAGQGAFATLTPRQAVSPAPYALYAADARQSLGDFTVQSNLWVSKTGIFGGTDDFTGISVRAPDIYLNADPFYERGAGGRVLVHDFGNTLTINHSNDFAGGVRIGGGTTITGDLTVEGKTLRLMGWDLYMNAGADRGDGGRALVHAPEDRLVLNFEGDFAGGVDVHSSLRVDGVLTSTKTVVGRNLHLTGDNLTFTDHNQPGGILWLNRSAALGYANVSGAWSTDAQEGDIVLRAHDGARILLARGQATPDHPAALIVEASGLVSIPNLQTGGLVEANLQTSQELHSATLERFAEGDVLCWSTDAKALEHCVENASPLVVAVANGSGKPLIAGVEWVKVTGSVQPGDLLVSSATAGYAVAWRSLSAEATPPGVVIAKALEANEVGEGVVQALILLR